MDTEQKKILDEAYTTKNSTRDLTEYVKTLETASRGLKDKIAGIEEIIQTEIDRIYKKYEH